MLINRGLISKFAFHDATISLLMENDPHHSVLST